MFKFLLKGILRDKSRSILPIIIVSIGVALTVFLSGFIRGALGDIIDQNARFQTGHLKVITKAYQENMDQLPIDLSLLDVDSLMTQLKADFPNVSWVERTRFGGLIDVPDGKGDTKGQGPAVGMAFELFNESSHEIERMNILQSIVKGSVPTKQGEVLVGYDFADKLNVNIGDEITYVGSTMYGSMTFMNFTVSGTIKFGTPALDKGAVIMDITDAQAMLDMDDATGEILGYLDDGVYNNSKAEELKNRFNKNVDPTDEYAPVMMTLKSQNNLASYIDYMNVFSSLFVGIFVFAMSLVLWNTGLLAGLRRYKEFGIRLALGESKGKIYGRLVMEAIIIGVIGSIIGSIIGISLTLYMQRHGIDISSYVEGGGSMMMPSVMRAKFTTDLFYIGFIPGLVAMVIGNMLSGTGIYRRETANLFKELEV